MKKNKFIKITVALVLFFGLIRLLWFGFLNYKGVNYDAFRIFFKQNAPCVEIKNLSLSKNISGHLVIKNCTIDLKNPKDFFSSFCCFYKMDYVLKSITYQSNHFCVFSEEFFGNLEHLNKDHYMIHKSYCKKLSVSKKDKTVMFGDVTFKGKYQNHCLDFDFYVLEGVSSKGKLLLRQHKRPKGEVSFEFKDFKLYLKKIADLYPMTKITRGVLSLFDVKPNQKFLFDLHHKGINLGPLRIYSY